MHNTRLGRMYRGRFGVVLTLMLLVSLLVPVTAMAAPVQSNPGNTEWVQVYTVKRGDTLSGIAWSFGVSEEALIRANTLRDADAIYVGQQLIIPEKGHQGTGGPECVNYHTVRRADTLSAIALYYGIDEYALARANGIYDLNEVYIGQTLCIPGGGSKPQPQPAWEPERPTNKPQEQAPSYEPQQPANQGPQRPSGEPQRPSEPSKNDGPVRPSDEPQRPSEPAKNEGPVRPGNEPQRPNEPPKQEGPVRPGDGPQRPEDKPWGDDRDHNDKGDDKGKEPLRPTEYWKGTYFKDKYFSEFAMERQDLEVNFNWFTGSPFENSNEDRFSVRWEKVEYFKGGPYRFFAIADDGVRVYVDDQLIIDAWVIQPATEYKADLNLSDGPHKLVVEYYEEAEDAQIRVYWEPRRPNK